MDFRPHVLPGTYNYNNFSSWKVFAKIYNEFINSSVDGGIV